MRLPILAGTVAALLAGCTDTVSPRLSPELASAGFESACQRGAIDSDRAFLLCPAGNDGQGDAAMALKQQADLGLDIASVAAEYGIARESAIGIEAATYSRIVGKRPEAKARAASRPEQPVVIDGRNFRKVTLEADGKAPKTLFIEG